MFVTSRQRTGSRPAAPGVASPYAVTVSTLDLPDADLPDAAPTVGMAALIRNRLGECSPAERKVARALLASYPAAGLGTVAELADQAQVSAPTVLRLLTRLGFGGYPDFQRALRAELAERDTSPLSAYSAQAHERHQPGDALANARSVLPEAVARTLRDLPDAEIQAAVRLLADRQLRVTAYGGRFSRLLAHYLVLHLIQIRGNARMLPDAPVERVDALVDVGRRDLVVLFDYRRYEDATEALARAVVERGAKIILCTDQWLSPIAGLATVVLPCAVDSPSAYDSFTPSLAVLETVIAALIERSGQTTAQRLAQIEETGRHYSAL
jgi:DNA-binding MurR/RpiR family transcriptional regulator